jgi:hypothetical protein
MAKRTKASVPSTVPYNIITWWGPGWTLYANTAPVVTVKKFLKENMPNAPTHASVYSTPRFLILMDYIGA